MLVEVVLGSGFKSIHAMTKRNLVAVHGKDLRFGKVPLNLNGQHGLLDLAAEVTLRREKQIAGKLHGERGCALRTRTRSYIAVSGAHYSPEIDAPMLLKILVFNGHDCIPQNFGEIIVGSQDAPLQSERANDFAGIVIQLRDGAGAVVLQFADLRQ